MAGPIRGIQKLTEEDVARAVALFRQDLSPEAVRGRLVEGGMSPEVADDSIRVAGERRLAAESFEMLANGQRPDAVKAFLVGKGVSPFVADEVVQDHLIRLRSMGGGPGAVRRVVGGIVVALGVGLIILHLTGVFRTALILGFIVIIIGSSIAGS